MAEALQLQAAEPERDTAAEAFPTTSLIFSTGCTAAIVA
jgi:hypothetical protein